MKEMKIAIVIAVLALALLISGISCKRETTVGEDVQQLENDIGELDNASQDIEELDLDFNESELEEIEGLF